VFLGEPAVETSLFCPLKKNSFAKSRFSRPLARGEEGEGIVDFLRVYQKMISPKGVKE